MTLKKIQLLLAGVLFLTAAEAVRDKDLTVGVIAGLLCLVNLISGWRSWDCD